MTSTSVSSRPPPEGMHDFLGRSRWFAGKGSPYAVTEVEVLGVLASEPRVEVWLVRVDQGGTLVPYHLPVEIRSEPDGRLDHVFIGHDDSEWFYDALHDRDANSLWLSLLDGSLHAAGLSAHPIAPLPEPEGYGRVLTAEQSNTSVVYGSSLILKVFRRAQSGINPDVEVHAALARAGSPHVAQPYGWIESESGVVAFAQEFLTGGAEGWELATGSVRDLLREGDLYAEEVGGDFAGESYRLGVTTAEVHAAMRETLPTDSWRSPELRSRADELQRRLTAALESAPALRPFADAVLGVYEELAALPDPVPVQRVHGDLHLAQTMRVTSGWKILDFEGEPARPVAERRALDSPLRDVAGMLRSFDYAARYPLGDLPPDPQAVYRAAEWAGRNREAFCDGYAHAAGADPRDQDVLLRAYEADKVVYEVVYESRMRPAWVSIPMSALERLAG